VFGYTIKNGLHTSDLNFNLTAVKTNSTDSRTSDAEAGKAHEIFASALSVWLPAYTPFAAGATPIKNGTSATATPTPKQSLVSVSGAAEQRIGKGGLALMTMALGMVFFC
jgi:hypothetical protein